MRALVVIDAQNEYDFGLLPIVHPPLADSVANITAAMDAATAVGVPVIVVQHTAVGAPIFAPGTAGWELMPAVAGRPRDHHVEKTHTSSFTGTDLGEWLAARGVDTVTIAGYMTQNCDQATAIDAHGRGLAVEFLSDATGTLDFANEQGRVAAAALHQGVLVVMQSNFAAVATTEEWIAAIVGGGVLAGSNVVASTR